MLGVVALDPTVVAGPSDLVAVGQLPHSAGCPGAAMETWVAVQMDTVQPVVAELAGIFELVLGLGPVTFVDGNA